VNWIVHHFRCSGLPPVSTFQLELKQEQREHQEQEREQEQEQEQEQEREQKGIPMVIPTGQWCLSAGLSDQSCFTSSHW
jgi:hypothetical protein